MKEKFSQRTGGAVTILALVGALIAGAPLALDAQTREMPRISDDIPRTPTGNPDLNGLWQALGNHHWDIEPNNPRAALQMEPGPVVPVPAREVLALGAIGAVPWSWGIVDGGRVPYTSEGLAQRERNRENYLDLDPNIRCYLPGVPRATYMPFPFQIFQSEDKFFIAYEYAGAVRDVYLGEVEAPPFDTWMGHSVGHWEGDTFVVEVTALNDRMWMDRAGNQAGWQTTVTERYTLIGPNHIWYEATIEDPDTFTEPVTISLPLYRHIDPNARLGQFKCVPFVEELMYGEFRRTPVGGDQDP